MVVRDYLLELVVYKVLWIEWAFELKGAAFPVDVLSGVRIRLVWRDLPCKIDVAAKTDDPCSHRCDCELVTGTITA